MLVAVRTGRSLLVSGCLCPGLPRELEAVDPAQEKVLVRKQENPISPLYISCRALRVMARFAK